MASLRTRRIAATLILAYCSVSFCVDQSFAESIQVRVRGTVSAVTAIYAPLFDPIGLPPPPQPSPEFVARFATGQSVVIDMTYSLGAADNIAATSEGRYAVDSAGSITVDGARFNFGGGVVDVQTDQPYMPRTDQFYFHSATLQQIASPVQAYGTWLDLVLHGDGMIGSDALVPPPAAWDTAMGYLYFQSQQGVVWPALYFNIDQIDAALNPLADFDANGVVNGADYIVWRKGLGTKYTQNDYNSWRAHYGPTAGGAGASVNESVPEPATLTLLFLAALAMYGIRTSK